MFKYVIVFSEIKNALRCKIRSIFDELLIILEKIFMKILGAITYLIKGYIPVVYPGKRDLKFMMKSWL